MLAALVLSLALPLREYLAQRGRIEELRTRGDATQARIDELAAAQRRWSDPAYVTAQARQRLHFVMPGEVGYVVLGPEEAPAPGTPAPARRSGPGTARCGAAWSARGAPRPPRPPRRPRDRSVTGECHAGPETVGVGRDHARAVNEPASPADLAAVAAQLGRPPRGVRSVAHRCRCGLPDVVETEPRLPDGSPFPTLYYLTCPRAAGAVGRLEAEGVMRAMQDRLAADPELAERYRAAHTALPRRPRRSWPTCRRSPGCPPAACPTG